MKQIFLRYSWILLLTFTLFDTLSHAKHGSRYGQSLVLFRLAVIVVTQFARPRSDVVSMPLSQACHAMQRSHTNDVLSQVIRKSIMPLTNTCSLRPAQCLVIDNPNVKILILSSSLSIFPYRRINQLAR